MWIFFILLILSQPIWSSQTILLKNGTSVKGDVIGQNEKNITVRTSDGSNKVFSKRSILKVIYRDVNEEEAKRIRLEEENKIKAAKTVEEKKQIEEEAIVAKPESKTFGTRNRWSLVWRSAVLPGWGHWKGERKKTSIFYGSLFWGGISATLSAASKVSKAKSAYDDASLNAQLIVSGNLIFGELIVSGKRSEYKKSIQDYQNVAAATVLIYLLQLTHVYFSGITWEQEEVAVSPEGSFLKKGIQLDSMRESNPIHYHTSAMLGWRAEARYNWFF
ncbi:hypothetical protein AB3N59_10510 [Leptospira sp. WS92.C1]